MKDGIIWSCMYCKIVPTVQSNKKCPRCGRRLTPCDYSEVALERRSDWPTVKKERSSSNGKDEEYIDYSDPLSFKRRQGHADSVRDRHPCVKLSDAWRGGRLLLASAV